MEIIYRSFEDLARTIRSNIHKIPHDIDAVIGVPRSGMIPAYLIGLYLNKPVLSVAGFLEAQRNGGGKIACVRSRTTQQIHPAYTLWTGIGYRR